MSNDELLRRVQRLEAEDRRRKAARDLATSLAPFLLLAAWAIRERNR